MNPRMASVEAFRRNLVSAGVGRGTSLLLHSGLGDIGLAQGPDFDPVKYASEIVEMLTDLVGEDGTVVMSTDSIADPREFAYRRRVFEPERMRSRRGMISEVFRLFPGSLRSRHPWCNATAWGRHAEWLIEDHLSSTPFAMDRNSPWFRLTQIDAFIVYFGVNPGNANLCSVIPENVLGYEYPVGAHFDKPLILSYRSKDGNVVDIPVLTHVHDWYKSEMVAFFLYLDRLYDLHHSFGTGNERIVVCKAKHQLDVLMTELDKRHPFIHVRYWL